MMLQPNLPGALEDRFLARKLKEIIKELRISAVVETGVNEGKSTRDFAKMAETVIGIDNDRKCIESAESLLRIQGSSNYELLLGNSPDVLRTLVSRIDRERTMFFLDAHWESYWPLNDEIRSIPRGRGVIVIHDCLVPGEDLGYDSYGGTLLTYDYISGSLRDWSPRHRIEYNSRVRAEYPWRVVLFAYAN